MNVRNLMLAGLAAAALFSAPIAKADEGATETKAPVKTMGEKKYKARINIVARKPLRHDVPWYEATYRDRHAWHDFTTWQGTRDQRPLVARKSMGFHAPRPHRGRSERVLLVSRGPLKGPAPAK